MSTEPTTGPMTGLTGTVSMESVTPTDIRRWEVTRENDVKVFSSSSTSGYEKNAKGVSRWSGRYEIYLDAGEQDVGPEVGDLQDFIGTSHTAKTITGEVRVSNIEVGIDIEGAEFSGATVSFVGNGAWVIA